MSNYTPTTDEVRDARTGADFSKKNLMRSEGLRVRILQSLKPSSLN